MNVKMTNNYFHECGPSGINTGKGNHSSRVKLNTIVRHLVRIVVVLFTYGRGQPLFDVSTRRMPKDLGDLDSAPPLLSNSSLEVRPNVAVSAEWPWFGRPPILVIDDVVRLVHECLRIRANVHRPRRANGSKASEGLGARRVGARALDAGGEFEASGSDANMSKVTLVAGEFVSTNITPRPPHTEASKAESWHPWKRDTAVGVDIRFLWVVSRAFLDRCQLKLREWSKVLMQELPGVDFADMRVVFEIVEGAPGCEHCFVFNPSEPKDVSNVFVVYGHTPLRDRKDIRITTTSARKPKSQRGREMQLQDFGDLRCVVW